MHIGLIHFRHTFKPAKHVSSLQARIVRQRYRQFCRRNYIMLGIALLFIGAVLVVNGVGLTWIPGFLMLAGRW